MRSMSTSWLEMTRPIGLHVSSVGKVYWVRFFCVIYSQQPRRRTLSLWKCKKPSHRFPIDATAFAGLTGIDGAHVEPRYITVT